uniref:DUF1211 domain-containing protein n=1 Tax=Ascaris lumbricoides TaxID=6252 RepID=A0A0M3I5D3_ASCLU
MFTYNHDRKRVSSFCGNWLLQETRQFTGGDEYLDLAAPAWHLKSDRFIADVFFAFAILPATPIRRLKRDEALTS